MSIDLRFVCSACDEVNVDNYWKWHECPNPKCEGHIVGKDLECCQGCYICECGAYATCGECEKCDECCECEKEKE